MELGKVIQDIVPAKARKVIYVILALAALGFGLWQASEGDWGVFVGSLLTSLVGVLAAGNTDTKQVE